MNRLLPGDLGIMVEGTVRFYLYDDTRYCGYEGISCMYCFKYPQDPYDDPLELANTEILPENEEEVY